MQNPEIWSDTSKFSKLNIELKRKKTILDNFEIWSKLAEDATVAIELEDKELISVSFNEINSVLSNIEKFELEQMLSGEYDEADAIVTINSGAGGTDAQDWAQMLLRMYSRWGENRGWKVELLDKLDGEVKLMNLIIKK